MSGNILAHKSIRLATPTRGAFARADGVVRPSDTLIDRNQQLKHITKSYIAYYTGLAHIETATAKSTLAAIDTIQVPFHEGHAFMGEGGFQQSLYAIRDHTRVQAGVSTTLAEAIEKDTVAALQAVRTELKAHIALLHKEATTLADEAEKEREISAGHLTQLQQGIDTFENSIHHMLPQHDPYITHIQVAKQLEKQVHKENELQTCLIKFQQMQPEFEAAILSAVQKACASYDVHKTAAVKELVAIQEQIRAETQRVDPSAEYKHFATIDTSLIDPSTPLRSVEAVTFPGLGHPSTIPIKEGQLERKKRFTKSYKESFYVLTPSGYLQERKSNNDNDPTNVVPLFSLFLPECSLGQPAKEGGKSHKFHLDGNKAHKSTFESKMKSLRIGGNEHSYAFRARTHQEMTAWWVEMEKLSKDTKLPVATPVKAGNPISDAVANVGRAAPVAAAPAAVAAVPVAVTAEEEEEEGGSSAEEEDEIAATTSATLRDSVATTEEGLPVYAGTGTTAAEKAGLHEKGAPVLGAVASEGGEASTSKGWFS